MPAISPNAWITYPRPNPQARLRLFCFPYAGGAASAFCTWSNDLPRDVEVCPVQLPGRESRLRDTPFTQLQPLVQALMQAVQPHLNKPFAFFGHSMGATIGFELAREMRRQQASGPAYLFVSGGRAPQIPDPDPPIHHLPEKEFVAGLRRFNGTPEEVLRNPELMELFLPLLRADLAVVETYCYADGEPLDCPISAFGGLEDEKVSQDEIAAWRDQTHGAFTLRMLPGDHFFLRTARTLLLHAMSQDLRSLLSQMTGG